MKFTAEQIAGILDGEVSGILMLKCTDCLKLKKVPKAHSRFCPIQNI
jgi:hypothetical protein